MKHKRVTLACMGLMTSPALAVAQSSVTIYGTLNADIESVKTTGAADPAQDFASRTRVTSNSSNVGLRGSEDLGSGLKAFFQIESAVNIDDGTSSGFWASRNSGVGLQSAWGQVLVGQWDSPYKFSTLRFDPTGNTGIGAYTGILGGTGSITAGQGGSTFDQRASFDRRVRNVVQYWTPNWNGLSARFAYGAPDGEKGSAATGVPEGSGLTPWLFSALGAYEQGPLYATVAYEEHQNFEALNTLLAAAPSSGKDEAWKGGISYGFLNNALTVGAIYEHLDYQADDINGLGELERKVDDWYAVGKYEIGPHVLGVAYGEKGDEKLSGAGLSDLPDSKAHQITARYGYNFSKRTQLYALATHISNQSNAFQTFGNSPLTATALFQDPARGADSSGAALGIIHVF